MKNSRRFYVFVACLVITYLVAGLGSIFTSGGTQSDWYKEVKPSITPPNWVFPIVWNILFFLIALSLYFSWINVKNRVQKREVVGVFAINFIFNILWSTFYFGMQNPLLAFVDILLLIISIFYMMRITYKINNLASWLLLPYLLWVCFASILNFLSI